MPKSWKAAQIEVDDKFPEFTEDQHVSCVLMTSVEPLSTLSLLGESLRQPSKKCIKMCAKAGE